MYRDAIVQGYNREHLLCLRNLSIPKDYPSYWTTEIRGIDQLKSQTKTFVQQIKVQQEQQTNPPNPLQEKINLEKNKLAAELQRNQLQHAYKTMELGLTKQSIDTARMKLMADVQMAKTQISCSWKKIRQSV